MKHLFLIFVSLFAFRVNAQATYPAADCSEAQVLAAFNAEIATSVDGDIITIPVGSCTWTGTTNINVSFPNSVTIQGAGAISATTSGTTTTGTDQTVIIDHLGSPHPSSTMIINIAAGKTLRFTGIAFLEDAGSLVAANGIIYFSGGTGATLRLDHNHFFVNNGGAGPSINAALTGVADHDFIESPANSSANPNTTNNPLRFHNGAGTNNFGDVSWTQADNWGTSGFFFVEDTQWLNGWLGEGFDGGRYVIRHSTWKASNSHPGNGQMANHGLTNGRERGARAIEIYQNSFVNPQDPSCGNCGAGNVQFSVNSGTMLYWGNMVTQYRGAVSLDYDCRPVANNTLCPNYAYSAPPNGWGHCGTAFGPSNWDGNTNSTGYPCMDQPGRGAGQLVTGTSFPSIVNSSTGTVAWLNQAVSPVYIFNNTYTTASGFTASPLVKLGGTSAPISENRDFYQDPSCATGGGAQTAGVCVGPLSARQINCTAGPGGNTPGVGFWDTGTNTLYVCNPTNIWTVYYTPFVYPHPLVTGNPPPNLTPAGAQAPTIFTKVLTPLTDGRK